MSPLRESLRDVSPDSRDRLLGRPSDHPGTTAVASPVHGGTSVRSLVLVWCVTSVTALAVAPTDRRVAAAVVFLGAMAALMVSGPTVLARLVTVVALFPALLPDSVSLPWICAAVLMAFVGVVGADSAREQSSQLSEPRRHLMRCRRRGEPAAVFVAALPGDRREARRVAEKFRVTDSVEVIRCGRRYEIHGVLDAGNFDRGGIERRVFHEAGGVLFGWASFPDDGVTLDVLVERARGKVPAEEAAVAGRPPTRSVPTVSTLARDHASASFDHPMAETR